MINKGIFLLFNSLIILELLPVNSSPSVNRMIALLLLLATLKALTAVVKAFSRLVPPIGTNDGFNSLTYCSNATGSEVNGQVK